MDRHLKERMVGAVVVVATAVILFSEMLSGPRSTSQSPAASATTENRSVADDGTKLKTYTIDLSKPTPATASPTAAASTPEPSVPSAMAVPPSSTSDRIVTTAVPPVEDSTPSAAVLPKPEPSSSASPSSSPAESPRTTLPIAHGGWAVQVGSFGVRATSERVAADLKREGFSAFVVAFQSGNQTMYRVRVGPERNRETAEVLLRKLKLRHPAATLVAPT